MSKKSSTFAPEFEYNPYAMKIRNYLLLTLLLPLASIFADPFYSIKVVKLNGQEYSQAFDLIGRLEFVNDSMYLVSTNGQILGRELRTDVQKIAFGNDSNTVAVPSVETNSRIQIYPNPVLQSLIIKGAQTNETVRIFTLTGTLITTATVFDELTTIDLSNLPVGQYLLQVNTQIVKLIKQ